MTELFDHNGKVNTNNIGEVRFETYTQSRRLYKTIMKDNVARGWKMFIKMSAFKIFLYTEIDLIQHQLP